MALYKTGDVVVVRPDLKLNEYYLHGDGSNNFTGQPMVKLAGQPVTISSVGKHYTVKEAGGWLWTDDMFEGFAGVEERNLDVSMILNLL